MKKTGKALSLVLSLALVVSSLTATFASAAATPAATGASVALSKSSYALAVDTSSGATAPTGVALPNTTITYTRADGAKFTVQGDAPSTSWTSSNPAVVKLDRAGNFIPVAPGTATLTCNVANDQPLTYGTDALKDKSTIKLTGTASVTVTVYKVGSFILTNDTTGTAATDGTALNTQQKLAVNDTTEYGLYKVGTEATGCANFKQVKVIGDTDDATADDVVKITSDKQKVLPTAVTFAAAVGEVAAVNTAKVTAQPTDSVYIGSDQLTAAIYDKDGKFVKSLAALPVEVDKLYNAADATTISSTPSYGSTKTTNDKDAYVLTGYDINGAGKVTLNDATVGNVSATEADVTGGTVGNIIAPTVKINDDGTKMIGASVGSVSASTSAAVTGAKAAVTVGDITAPTVAVDGAKATVGDVHATTAITVGATTPGATTGSLIGDPTYDPDTQNTNVVSDHANVTVIGGTVKGDIVGHTIAVSGKGPLTKNDDPIPATVNGNITVYTNTKTTGAGANGTVTVGNTATSDDTQIANVTVGNITAANTGSTITVQQATASDKKTKSTTTVGSLNGFAPQTKDDTTEVDFVNYTGSFASLPNFTTVSIDADSDVKVASALTTTNLTLAGTAELSSAAVGTLTGKGTLKMPAGSLIVKTDFATGPVKLVPTSPVAVNQVLFSSVANKANMVQVDGVTIDSKASATVANGYDYFAKTVKGTGLTITGDGVADNKTTVAAGSTKTLTATVVPAGQTLPDGEKVAWVLTSGKNSISVTPSSDTLSATVAASAYDPQDKDGVNEDTVTAYVVDANGNKDINYSADTCAIQATPAVTLTTTVTDLDGNVINATSDTVVKIQQSTELRVHFNADKAGISDINYVTGNDKVAQTNTVSAWNGTSGVYTIYTNGAVGSKVGVYAAGHRVFQVEITDRPFKCDTSVDFSMKAGKTYTFKITPNAGTKIDNFTFLTGNDAALSTWGCWKQADGTMLARVKAVSAGRYGVYAKINGVTYKVFAITVQ